MIKVSSLAVVTLALFQTSAFAGGWSQSGGQTFKDALNPWFLSNVTEVTYCIDVDTSTISATPGQIDHAITRALQYWKKEFDLANHVETATVDGTDITVRIDTQTFVKHTKCNGSEDIQFLFGYGTIVTHQDIINFLQEPRNFIGVSVRTDYDLVNLKAKGFVYFSSDEGPNKFFSGTETLDQPFAHDGILYRVIAHELGHIFGIPHMGNIEASLFVGNNNTSGVHVHSDLMSAQFPEWCVRKNVAASIENQELEPFFLAPEYIVNCKVKSDAIQWLGLDPKYKCLEIKYEYDTDSPATVSASVDANSPQVTVGTIDGKLNPNDDFRLSLEQAVTIVLNDQQKVFPTTIWTSFGYESGPSIWSYTFESTLVLNNKETRSVSLKLGPKNYELLGIKDNRITLLMDSDSTGVTANPGARFSFFSKQHSSR
jgi:hypothetical protein